jgi:hypothetical protein
MMLVSVGRVVAFAVVLDFAGVATSQLASTAKSRDDPLVTEFPLLVPPAEHSNEFPSNSQITSSFVVRLFLVTTTIPDPTTTPLQLKTGKVASNSYVPAGLTLAQYQKIRAADESKKDSNYKKNVSKAFKFQNFDEFYLKRGTDVNGKWLNAPGKGHTFTKTKYDYAGEGSPNMSDAKVPEAFSFPSIFGGGKKK